jgi:uncharacterized secreted protein with C-terminal beta-propeller domain
MTGKMIPRARKGSVIAAGLVLIAIVAISAIGISVTLLYPGDNLIHQESLKKFSSCEDMQTFLEKNSGGYGGMLGGAMAAAPRAGMEATGLSGGDQNKASGPGTYSDDYSTTNIQIEGVDEADIIKSDGKYLYIVTGGKVIIVDAYPAEGAQILAEMNMTGIPQEIFISDDRMAVFMSGGRYWGSNSGSEILVYDVSDRTNPVLKRNTTLEGYYYDSRMIGDYVYVISKKHTNSWTEPGIPRIATTVASEVGAIVDKPVCDCEDVYYFDVPDSSYQFTTITSLNLKDDAIEPQNKVFLMGYSQTLFVSLNNIYITYKKNIDYLNMLDRMIDEVLIPSLPADVVHKFNEIRASGDLDYDAMQEISEILYNYTASLGPEEGAEFMQNLQKGAEEFYIKISKETDRSVVHRIRINNGEITYEAGGSFPGRVLNQFSMDEDNGYFRVATTTGGWMGGVRAENLNHVYVLDLNLNIVGKLEDLAKGESIFSARFIGDRMYMVTFERVDPLFVIDLSNPANPKVLGELKIQGYSDYLHPYDNNHVIGLGMDADENGRTTNLKISLFDVSDVSNPEEISKYVFGGRGAYSYALHEHKAFLFDKDKELIVIPARVYDGETTNEFDWNWRGYWHGAYVFQVNLNDGIVYRGRIAHQENVNETEYWMDHLYDVKRSLFMDSVLYTLSESMLKMNSLINLEFINSLDFPINDYYGPVYRGGDMVMELGIVNSPQIDQPS